MWKNPQQDMSVSVVYYKSGKGITKGDMGGPGGGGSREYFSFPGALKTYTTYGKGRTW
jgi:hypothetical protein